MLDSKVLLQVFIPIVLEGVIAAAIILGFSNWVVLPLTFFFGMSVMNLIYVVRKAWGKETERENLNKFIHYPTWVIGESNGRRTRRRKRRK